jgi:hypothetical protein
LIVSVHKYAQRKIGPRMRGRDSVRDKGEIKSAHTNTTYTHTQGVGVDKAEVSDGILMPLVYYSKLS